MLHNTSMKSPISITQVTHLHIDLWGYSDGWIDTIQDKFLEAAPAGSEAFKCLANISCLAYAADNEIQEILKVIQPLLNLAEKARDTNPNVVYRHHGT